MLHLGGYQILPYFYLRQSLGFYITFTRNIHNINHTSSLLNYTCLGTTTNFAGEQVHTILNEKLADFRGVKQFNTNVESEKKSKRTVYTAARTACGDVKNSCLLRRLLCHYGTKCRNWQSLKKNKLLLATKKHDYTIILQSF